MAVVEDVRPLGAGLERSYQVYVRGRLKFRVKQIVYVAFSLDETELGFAFPKEERAALVTAQPHRFHLPQPSDLRFNWVVADLATLDRHGGIVRHVLRLERRHLQAATHQRPRKPRDDRRLAGVGAGGLDHQRGRRPLHQNSMPF